jgi:hypothetical protein
VKSDLAVPAYGAAAALLLVLVWEWLPAADSVLPPPPQIIHVRGRAVAETDSVAKDTQAWANAITRRPLFNIGRKPAKLATGHGPVALTGLPRLSGIMITRAGRRAIFMPEGGKALTLAEGATLDDYTIRRILADQVVLNGAKGDMVLRPAYDAARGGGMTITNGEMPAQPGPQTGGFPVPPFTPGFRPPGMPMPQPPPQPNSDDDDNSDAPSPPQVQPQPFPGFRGPFIPRGRSQ